MLSYSSKKNPYFPFLIYACFHKAFVKKFIKFSIYLHGATRGGSLCIHYNEIMDLYVIVYPQ